MCTGTLTSILNFNKENPIMDLWNLGKSAFRLSSIPRQAININITLGQGLWWVHRGTQLCAHSIHSRTWFELSFYADDTPLYLPRVSVSKETATSRLEACVNDINMINTYVSSNLLKLNYDKTMNFANETDIYCDPEWSVHITGTGHLG